MEEIRDYPHYLATVRDSGLGREGIRFAVEDMSEIRLLVIRGEGGE